MKKRSIALTVLIAFIFLCIVAIGEYLAQADITLSLTCESDGTEIKSWQDEHDNVYFFLPSGYENCEYLLSSGTEMTGSFDNVIIDGSMKLSDIDVDEAHELRYRKALKTRELTVYFLKSEGVHTLYVNTATGSMREVDNNKDLKEPVSVIMTDGTGKVEYRNDTVKIKGRGNSSWKVDKKSYNLLFESDVALLGMAPAAKWALIANAYDYSKVKNKLVTDLVQDTFNGWNPNCEYINLYLNGEYNGLYLLSESIEIKDSKISEEETSILVATNLANRVEDEHGFVSELGQGIEIKETALSEGIALECTVEKVKELEQYLIDVQADLSEIIDMDSWARHYILDELFANADSGCASLYIYWKNEEGSKIYASPVWDYDICLFSDRCAGNLIAATMTKNGIVSWYNYLSNNSGFMDYVAEVYRNEFCERVQRLTDGELLEYGLSIESDRAADRLRWNSLNFKLKQQGYIDYADDESLQERLLNRVTLMNALCVENRKLITVRFYSMKDSISDIRCYTFEPGETLGVILAEGEYSDLKDVTWVDAETLQVVSEDAILEHNIVLKNVKESDSGEILSIRQIDRKELLLLAFLAAFGVFFVIMLIHQISNIKNGGKR